MQKIIGITGGTGCGKTTALKVLEQMGVHIVDCDALYHQMLIKSPSLVKAIDEAFPGAAENGMIISKKLGRYVFGDPQALERLNQIAWPFVVDEVKHFLKSHSPHPCAIDAIGLKESGLSELCTHTVAITAPEDVRIRRLTARENIPEEYARLRIRAQKKNEVFAADCGVTIDNPDDDAEGFRLRCTAVFETILKEDALI